MLYAFHIEHQFQVQICYGGKMCFDGVKEIFEYALEILDVNKEFLIPTISLLRSEFELTSHWLLLSIIV